MLASNTTGGDNVATGSSASVSNTMGGGNVGNGNQRSLAFNSVGGSNTAVGETAFRYSTWAATGTPLLAHKGCKRAKIRRETRRSALRLYDKNTNGQLTPQQDTKRLNCTGNTNIAIGNSAGFDLTNGDSILTSATLASPVNRHDPRPRQSVSRSLRESAG